MAKAPKSELAAPLVEIVVSSAIGRCRAEAEALREEVFRHLAELEATLNRAEEERDAARAAGVIEYLTMVVLRLEDPVDDHDVYIIYATLQDIRDDAVSRGVDPAAALEEHVEHWRTRHPVSRFRRLADALAAKPALLSQLKKAMGQSLEKNNGAGTKAILKVVHAAGLSVPLGKGKNSQTRVPAQAAFGVGINRWKNHKYAALLDRAKASSGRTKRGR
jgi:hypothetical protein